ncbi:MAG: hypothetical protein E3J56_13940 [Candidatus Aminicenantes bacterium]|nr:MAG: hypothetical protein E3J56_13940 [Candidatus Aminicenantes bacterium]
MKEDKALLAGLLAMASMFPMQHSIHDKPEQRPSGNQTKQFRKIKAKRKLAQASRRRNRG